MPSRRPFAAARRVRPGPRTLGILLLALLLAAAPFVPRGDSRDAVARRTADTETAQSPGALEPAGTGIAGRTRLTPDMRREIDRVVAEGSAQPLGRGRLDPATLVDREVRCATFEQLTYCLHVGWTDESPTAVQTRLATAAARAARTARTVENTGDLDPLAGLTRAARMTPRARAAADRTELTAAARSVAKVWTLEHEIRGVPYPAGFWSRHQDALLLTTAYAARAGSVTAASGSGGASSSPSATASAAAGKTKTLSDYPRVGRVLLPKQMREQVRTYWCGVSTTQAIVWGWTGRSRTQKHWAGVLGTTTSGTSISRIVQVINNKTGWDNAKHAGPYITLDVGDWKYSQWYLLLARHVHDYQAPLVLHPVLLKKYFPYLDDDASGHFQVGRGYRIRKDGTKMIGYFEPWNQQRFDPSEPFIKRVQWQRAYRSYRANLAHPFHNIGV